MNISTSTDQNSKYESIALSLKSMLEAGVLKAGDKLPSLRKVSVESKVSISTVLMAYELLENEGYIESRPKSGYVVLSRKMGTKVPTMPKKPKLVSSFGIDERISSLLDSLQNPNILQLGTAIPERDFLPIPSLHKNLKKAILIADSHNYQNSQGYPGLRKQLSIRSSLQGIASHESEIIVTNGCQDALNLCIQVLTKPGDLIAVESPVYFGILQSVQRLGRKVLEIPADPIHGMSLPHLDDALNKYSIQCIVLNPNFQNPTGSLLSNENKKIIVELCSNKNIPIIEDDIYGDLFFTSSRPLSLKSFDKKEIVYKISSYSKIISPDLRIGWILPGKKGAELQKELKLSRLALPSIPQIALCEYLKTSFERNIKILRRDLSSNLAKIRESVLKFFPEPTSISNPQGGLVFWIELPDKVDSLLLQNEAWKHNISIAPGPIFSGTGNFRNFLRLSGGIRLTPKVEEKIKTLGKLVAQLKKS
ncbi:PLP-dependent aminotransferase family protein [Leptospira sp. 201903071]|uniref:aminotransferase-like domain-containing protein n=1 Tax=Leptospira ainazelensis TaxID=2810034 RepID=UPI001962C9D7|nr:PLP-dependent aminotransferase family protein [Leptospira ainazelensis]MBM9499870.1 PLP-dependent aminotransferase family protein [Leptospira ainazelensis]